MPEVKDIFDYLNKIAPVSLKMDFDNVGILCGSKTAAVKKVLVALDITDAVIDEAAKNGVQLIVSHHPIIFNPIKSITDDDLTGRKLIKLIKHDISAICMHTNLDIAQDGVNDALMSALACPVQSFLEPAGTDDCGNEVGCGRIGEYDEEIEFTQFLSICKTALNASGLRYCCCGKPVKKLAVMGGAGGSALYLAKSRGCDTYVTADVKYNSFLDARELGINLIDADHFCTENVIVPVLAAKLSENFPQIEFSISQCHKQLIKFT